MNETLDECLRLVADSYRRTVLDHLQDTGETTSDDLVDAVRRADPDTERESIAVQLHHNHLPKLADYGVIEYDPDDGTVEYRPDERVESVLAALPADHPTPVAESRVE